MSADIPITDVTEYSEASIATHTWQRDRQTNRHNGKIYVRQISGFFQRIRRWTLSFQLFMYFSLAWVSIDGQQLILFDLEARKFHLFGITFWPQDFTLLAFALIISAFGLFFVTALYGRVWCGYSCPQTAWAFMFMWLEEFFEGSRHQRIKLDERQKDTTYWLKKTGKHLSWGVLALATAITFVGYFYPIRELVSDLLAFSVEGVATAFWICFFTVATYMNAGWLREKVCIYMCPYSRFQSVMFNENTQVISYDERRGEPRTHHSKSALNEQAGDCVDCKVCVQVCPVGIDIRDGLQYECIGCALCIDACDGIMEKLDLDKGLIRYASESELENGVKAKRYDARTLGYGAMLLLAVAVFAWLIWTRPPVELSVLRDRGALFQDSGRGTIENTYLLKVINKSNYAETFSLSVQGIVAESVSVSRMTVPAGEIEVIPLSVTVKPSDLEDSTSTIRFSMVADRDSTLRAETQSKFLAPLF